VAVGVSDQDVKDDAKWIDLYVSWSPQGTYFATLLRRGVRLWGGPTFQPQEKFAHPLVMMIDFSPRENYLVTWSHDPIVVPHDAQQLVFL
jgi:translation initiation factor 3 subunit B